jgi:hypothetical protein
MKERPLSEYASPAVVTVLVGDEHIDISYACEFDCGAGTIELPDNLPGGSQVYVDYEYLCTTAVSIEERAANMRNMRRTPLRPSLLAVAIGAILYG